jgi:aryl carrier-like protein
MPSAVSLDGLSPIPRNNGDSQSAQFRKFLSGKLPEYMIPSSFVFLRELPLTANGKIDRKALPDPDIPAEESAAPSATPSTDVERTLAEVWQEVLEVERVGVTDNFFDLGGNSLLMVRIYNKLRSIFGERVSIVKMFEYPTVSAFARYLSQESVEPQENSDHQAEKRKALRRRRGTKPSDAE